MKRTKVTVNNVSTIFDIDYNDFEKEVEQKCSTGSKMCAFSDGNKLMVVNLEHGLFIEDMGECEDPVTFRQGDVVKKDQCRSDEDVVIYASKGDLDSYFIANEDGIEDLETHF